MLRRASLVLLFVVLMPATVSAFDHDHHHDSDSDGDGCSSHSSSSSSSSSSGASVVTPSVDSSEKHVFITSTVYSGAIGSVADADARCQEAAASAGITNSVRAWISDGTHTAAYRVSGSGPWYTMNGDFAFDSSLAFEGPPSAAIVDEHGASSPGLGVWTGSDADGKPSGSDCEGWTNATVEATATIGGGGQDLQDSTWGGNHGTQLCNAKASILCFEQ